LESVAITFANLTGVAGLQSRIYTAGAGFLGDATAGSAGQTSYLGWTSMIPLASVTTILPSNVSGGQFVLELRGTNQGNFGGNLTVTPVPEPETLAMMLAGLGVVGSLIRKRNLTA
jgi:hypothetical protein